VSEACHATPHYVFTMSPSPKLPPLSLRPSALESVVYPRLALESVVVYPRLDRVGGVSAMADHGIWCEPCGQWLNGPTQYDDHVRGGKHRKAVKSMPQPPTTRPRDTRPRDKGVAAPPGTVLLVEQAAIYRDAVAHYTFALYRRALLRSRY